jgi:large subunit ribosomal protein L18
MKDKWTRYQFRKERTRNKIARVNFDRPRLAVHRTLRYLYAQVIDDASGKTLAFASSLSKELKAKKPGKNLTSAKQVGELIATKAKAAGVTKVAFDRGVGGLEF